MIRPCTQHESWDFTQHCNTHLPSIATPTSPLPTPHSLLTDRNYSNKPDRSTATFDGHGTTFGELDSLNDRVEGVAMTQELQQKIIAEWEEKLNALVEQFKKFESDEAAVEQYKNEVAGIVAQAVADLKKDMQQEMKQMQESHKQELEQTKQQTKQEALEQTKQVLEQTKQDMSQLETKFETKLNEVTEVANQAKRKADQAAKDVAEIGPKVDTAVDEAKAANAQSTQATESAARAEAQAAAAVGTVEKLKTELDSLGEQRKVTTALISNWQLANSEELEKHVTSMNVRMDALLGCAQNAYKKVEEVNGKHDDLQKSFNNLNDTFEEFKASPDIKAMITAEVSQRKFDIFCRLQDDVAQVATELEEMKGGKAEEKDLANLQLQLDARMSMVSRKISFILSGANTADPGDVADDDVKAFFQSTGNDVKGAIMDKDISDVGDSEAGFLYGFLVAVVFGGAALFFSFMGWKQLSSDWTWMASIGLALFFLVLGFVCAVYSLAQWYFETGLPGLAKNTLEE